MDSLTCCVKLTKINRYFTRVQPNSKNMFILKFMSIEEKFHKSISSSRSPKYNYMYLGLGSNLNH